MERTTPRATSKFNLPAGIIVLWHGLIANIPTGFALCDGNNGTPDLRDRFIVGARADQGGAAKTFIETAWTQTGGTVTHSHVAGNHQVCLAVGGVVGGGEENDYNSCEAAPGHSHTIAASGTLPQYYALAYIMKL